MLLRVKLVAFDSMGVRSMATLVETSEGAIFIDPGAALAPRRYGLPPHDTELRALSSKLSEIYSLLENAEYVVITHYHRDHYLYRRGEEEYYKGKSLFVKNPQSYVNYSQRLRAYVLFKKMGVETKVKSIAYVDGKALSIGKVRVEFSKPLPHGECNTKLGWVIAVAISEDDYTVVHASDVQGFVCQESLDFALERKWDLLIVSGPPTYLEPVGRVKQLLENMSRVVRLAKPGSTIIVDHHLLRDKNYAKYMKQLATSAVDVKVLTAAEFAGEEVRQLEAYRRELWEGREIPQNSKLHAY